MRCQKCGETDASLFYASIATHCKEHWKERVKAHRAANRDYYTIYEYTRAQDPHRMEARRKYQKTASGKEAHARATKTWRQRNKQVMAAHNAVAKALMRGTMKPLPCVVCGEVAEAHHPDYGKPLNVIWLCDEHHKEKHAKAKYA